MWKRNEEKYRSLSKALKRMCRKAKSQYYNKICNEIESLDKSHNPKMYGIVKQLRPKKLRSEKGVKNKDGKLLLDDKDILERWAECIEEMSLASEYSSSEELYSDERPNIHIETNSIHNTVNISEMEIRQTIVNLPKGKSTGIDEIPAEFLQNMGDKGIEMITLIVNKCYNTGLKIFSNQFLYSFPK